MDNNGRSKPDNMISLAEAFAFSGKFSTLFKDGMKLVEECAAYLDGEGRVQAKTLEKSEMVIYGTESMRLTTRLMQLASWLLLQRAANEGEMDNQQFLDEKKKIKLDTLPLSEITDEWSKLPVEFIELVRRSLTLQHRITNIDNEIYALNFETEAVSENPVDQQLNLLSTALGVSRKN